MFPAIAALLLTLASAPTGAVADQDCTPDSALDYVCGPEKPEDVLDLPGTRWLIASGFAPGAGLKLVDVPARSFSRWYEGRPDQIAPDRAHFPSCPGAVDPALFSAHGLALRRTGTHQWRLFAVNHGGRESIEIFDISLKTGSPALSWRGCVPMPPGQVANAVAAFADGTLLATVLTRPGTAIADFVAGRNTGGVWQWRPGDNVFTLLPGTELPGNNGLEVSPDQRHFYVVAFGWHSVLVYDRRDTTRALARIEAPGFMPDNVHWSGRRLLVAGMRLDEPACGGLRKVVNGVAEPMLCHRGWAVGALDLARGRIEIVAQGPPQPGFNGLSAAAIAKGELWLGSFQSSRLAIVRDWKPRTTSPMPDLDSRHRRKRTALPPQTIRL